MPLVGNIFAVYIIAEVLLDCYKKKDAAHMKDFFDCYSRLLIDSHITDIKDSYLSKLSPEEYVQLVKESGVESAMTYSCCHNGNCYYPTKVGHMHANLHGRDIFGETVALLRKNNITPIAYYTATYNNFCAKHLPHTVIVDNFGNTRDGRYRFTCPNQRDAVEFYKAQLREIIQYDIAGLFIDMSFWPSICVCDACRAKFGKPIPEVIDWNDPKWVEFQRFREKSMADFAAELTKTIKDFKPELSVTHQFSPVLHGWYLGQSAQLALASDYASGDFYGSNLQQRFGTKTFDAFTTKAPFEFMTSRCVNLHDHTSSKSDEELFLSALTTLANGGAYLFIDAINPDGSLNEKFYPRFNALNKKLEPFKNAIAEKKFSLDAEVGLFFSIECCVDKSLNGKKLFQFDGGCANNMQVRQNSVLDEALGTAEILIRQHIPFKIVKSGDPLDSYKAIIINNASYMTEKECEMLRNFVAKGGTLIATGETSLRDFYGKSTGNFQLAELFGVDFTGKYSDKVTYSGEEKILADNPAPLCTPRPGVEVRMNLSLTDFPVGDPDRYAAIHSNPPGDMTDYPALTVNNFGKGKCVWIAAPILILQQYTQQSFGMKLFAEFLPQVLSKKSDLHHSAELTMLKSADGKEHIFTIVNMQNDLPVVPLTDIFLELKAPFDFKEIIRISDGKSVAFERNGDWISLHIKHLEHAEFFRFQ